MGNNLGRETLHLRTFCSFYRPRFAPVLQVRKSLNYWGPLRGFSYVSSLNFLTSRFAFRGGSYVTVSIYYCICTFLCRCHSFNPSLCRLSSLFLPYVAVSKPCLLWYSFFYLQLSRLWQTGKKWPGPYETLGFHHLRAESYYLLLLFLL